MALHTAQGLPKAWCHQEWFSLEAMVGCCW